MQNEKIIVIKIGSSSIVKDENGNLYVDEEMLRKLAETCVRLKKKGFFPTIVSSGAVAAALVEKKNLETSGTVLEKPYSIGVRQALASIGQVKLMQIYTRIFTELSEVCSQILITYDTFRNREQYTNALQAFTQLFEFGVIPIVNENDSVATEELRSENDSLAAQLAGLLKAGYLFLLTDVDGVYLDNPNEVKEAKKVDVITLKSKTKPGIRNFDPYRNQVALCIEDVVEISGAKEQKSSGKFGSGGILVKINAGHLASSQGVEAVVLKASNCDKIVDYLSEGSKLLLGTKFERLREYPSTRKRWIRSLRIRGTIVLDKGAVEASKNRKNIYSAGIKSVNGEFPQMSAIKIEDETGLEVGVGLSHCDSIHLDQIKGLSTSEILKRKLGTTGLVIHRKNVSVCHPKPGKNGEVDYETNASSHESDYDS
eukprot:snap_masked-scaffold_9-processed-gene-1.25-mRNA-1 protein AED:0.44 eAED:0.44 QI:0/-1/0/1/-1/1/1/0/426